MYIYTICILRIERSCHRIKEETKLVELYQSFMHFTWYDEEFRLCFSAFGLLRTAASLFISQAQDTWLYIKSLMFFFFFIFNSYIHLYIHIYSGENDIPSSSSLTCKFNLKTFKIYSTLFTFSHSYKINYHVHSIILV